MTIFNKGLLLIVTPLVIQAVYIGMLVQSQGDAVRNQRWAVHTKQVIARVEEISRRLVEGYAGIRILVVSDDSTTSQHFRAAPEETSKRIDELRVLVSDNRSQRPRIDRLADQAQAFLAWSDAEERLTESGRRGDALDRLDEGLRLLGSVRTTTDEILAEEAQLDLERMNRLSRSTARQIWTTVGGGVALLAATLILALFFLASVINRLAVLRENADHLAEGRALEPPLSGSDEIALVDRAFHEMAKRLDLQKQENEMFVYSVSHDLRSPLINLQGFSEELSLTYDELGRLLRHEDVPFSVKSAGHKLMSENIADSIRYIQAAVSRLERIIDALLRLSRAGRVEYQLQKLDVERIVRKIVDALHDTIAGKRAKIIVGALPPAWGDPTAVEQIFANLIGNAVHYLDPARQGRIEVGCVITSPSEGAPQCHVYYVKDNGLGIPEAYHQRVFMAFNRLQADVAQGEGVGLALVRRMVNRLGGRIWLQSAAGVGTTFFVALPVPPSNGIHQAAEGRHATSIASGGTVSWQPSQS
jgi:signal transduction histidine kinase